VAVIPSWSILLFPIVAPPSAVDAIFKVFVEIKPLALILPEAVIWLTFNS